MPDLNVSSRLDRIMLDLGIGMLIGFLMVGAYELWTWLS